jgi:hypothetical protein
VYIVADGYDRLGRPGDAVFAAQAANPVAGERQPGRSHHALPCEQTRDRRVVVVDGQPPNALQRVGLGTDRAIDAAARQRDGDVGTGAAFPPDPDGGLGGVAVDGDDDLADQQPQQLLALPNCGAVGVEHRPQVSARAGQPGDLFIGEHGRRPGPLRGEVGLGLTQREKPCFPVAFETAGDQAVLRLDRVELAAGPLGLVAGPLDR